MNHLTPLALRGTGYTLEIIPEAIRLRDETITNAKAITAVTTEANKDAAIAAAGILKGLVKGCEECRKDIKNPVLQIGTDIDTRAREFKHPAEVEITRLEHFAARYVQEQREIADKARREQKAEARRLQQLETDRLAAIAKAEQEALNLKSKAAREAAQKEADRLRAEQMQAEIDQSEAAPPPVIETPAATGAQVVQSIELFATDLDALYKAYPQCVELKMRVLAVKEIVKHQIRSNKTVNIPGVEVSVTTGLNPRAKSSNLAIQ